MDTILRLMQPAIAADLGVTVVVENRAGASGAIGTAALARAPADGSTWGLVFDSHVINPALMPDLGFDPVRDLVAVMLVATAPMVIATPQERPWGDLPALLAAARARPETITYGTVGVGSLAHLCMTLLQERTGARLVHVPYRGGGPMSAAAAAGEIDLAVSSPAGGIRGLLRSRLRILAQTGAERSPQFPEVPTLAEAGVTGIDARAFWAMMGRAGVPAEAIARFHAACRQALAQAETRERMASGLAVDVIGSSPEECDAFLRRQAAVWAEVIRTNAIRLQ